MPHGRLRVGVERPGDNLGDHAGRRVEHVLAGRPMGFPLSGPCRHGLCCSRLLRKARFSRYRPARSSRRGGQRTKSSPFLRTGKMPGNPEASIRVFHIRGDAKGADKELAQGDRMLIPLVLRAGSARRETDPGTCLRSSRCSGERVPGAVDGPEWYRDIRRVRRRRGTRHVSPGCRGRRRRHCSAAAGCSLERRSARCASTMFPAIGPGAPERARCRRANRARRPPRFHDVSA